LSNKVEQGGGGRERVGLVGKGGRGWVGEWERGVPVALS
jgi:hypothetical protein